MFTLSKVSLLMWGGDKCVSSALTHKKNPIKLLSLILSLTLLFSTIPLTAFAGMYEMNTAALVLRNSFASSGKFYYDFELHLDDLSIIGLRITLPYTNDNNSVSKLPFEFNKKMDDIFGKGYWAVSVNNGAYTNEINSSNFTGDFSKFRFKLLSKIPLSDPSLSTISDSNNQQTATLTNTLNSQTSTLQTNLSNKATEMLYVANNNKTILSKLGIPLTATDGGVYTTNGGVRVQVIFYSPPTNLDQLSLS